jgi:putative PIG3 family NAD(P)H quinone oxidoreductase
MKAIVIVSFGDPSVLRLDTRPDPVPGEREVLVRVATAGVNRADLLQRRGQYPVPAGYPADIPGIEYAGVVEAVGAGVSHRAVGDRVMGLTGGGAYAEYVVVHEDECILIPTAMSFDDAAAIPEAFITAHDALFTQSSVQAGETVLIHAVGSGVGTAGVQLCKAHGCRVVGTARSASKLERARSLGLDVGIVAQDASFAASVTAAVGENAVDVVLELAGGDYLRDDIVVLATRGRIALVGLVAGRSATLDLGTLLRKRATLRGTVMRARSLPEKIAAASAFASHAMPLFASGSIGAVVDRVFELENAVAAHEYVEANENFGKVLLRV